MIVNEIINIRFRVKDTNYIVSDKGRVFNELTCRELKRTLVGYTQGFYIKGKFQSLKQLRKVLVKHEYEVLKAFG